MRDEKLEQIAIRLYDPKLNYHNFGHIRDVMQAGNKTVAKCKAEGVEIDEAAVYYAILFHDAGFIEDHVSKGFDSKEAYSAEIAVQILEENGIDKATVQKVKQAILATHVDAKCVSNEDKAVRSSDLAGLADEYKVFKQNTVDLKNELEMMTGKKITWEQWKALAADRIELFLREELHLTSDYYNGQGESRFHVNTRKNVNQLMQDPSEQI